jgi:hypothetical protein
MGGMFALRCVPEALGLSGAPNAGALLINVGFFRAYSVSVKHPIFPSWD